MKKNIKVGAGFLPSTRPYTIIQNTCIWGEFGVVHWLKTDKIYPNIDYNSRFRTINFQYLLRQDYAKGKIYMNSSIWRTSHISHPPLYDRRHKIVVTSLSASTMSMTQKAIFHPLSVASLVMIIEHAVFVPSASYMELCHLRTSLRSVKKLTITGPRSRTIRCVVSWCSLVIGGSPNW